MNLNEQPKVKILLAVRNEAGRRSMRAILEREADLAVVAETEDLRELIPLIADRCPDVAVMDLELAGLNVLVEVRDHFPDLRVVVTSLKCDSRYVVRALHVGATGYVLKDCAYEELGRAVRTMLSNRIWISPGIAGIEEGEVAILDNPHHGTSRS